MMHFLSIFVLFFFVTEINCLADKNCVKEIGELGNSQSKFIYCVTDKSVPVTMCIHCLLLYNDMVEKYDAILNDTACWNTIFDKDRINMIVTAQNALKGLWDRAYCDDCFNSNNYEKFDNISSNLNGCLATNPKKECKECLLFYTTLNSFYIKMDQLNNGKVCYDIQDAMNRTRLHWSKDLNCCKRISDMTLFVVAATIIGLMPIIFYTGIYFYSKRREINHGMLTEEDAAIDNTVADLMNNVVRHGFSHTNQINGNIVSDVPNEISNDVNILPCDSDSSPSDDDDINNSKQLIKLK